MIDKMADRDDESNILALLTPEFGIDWLMSMSGLSLANPQSRFESFIFVTLQVQPVDAGQLPIRERQKLGAYLSKAWTPIGDSSPVIAW